jgi:hypothetical protein
MIALDTTSMILRLVTTGTSAIDVVASCTEFGATSATAEPDGANITTAATTTVVTAIIHK